MWWKQSTIHIKSLRHISSLLTHPLYVKVATRSRRASKTKKQLLRACISTHASSDAQHHVQNQFRQRLRRWSGRVPLCPYSYGRRAEFPLLFMTNLLSIKEALSERLNEEPGCLGGRTELTARGLGQVRVETYLETTPYPHPSVRKSRM